jgi:uncharacterized protein with von Willebrand factor type A (vWA) domain
VLDQCGPEWKLVLVGDAAMHPAELLGAGDWEYWRTGQQGDTAKPGIRWLAELSDHFKKCAWLNPEPPSYWKGGTAEMIAGVFRMYTLTLEGLGEAIQHLSGAESRKR